MEEIIHWFLNTYPDMQHYPRVWIITGFVIAAALSLFSAACCGALLSGGLERSCNEIVIKKRHFYKPGIALNSISMLARWLHLFFKETVIPFRADKWIFILAPVLCFAFVFTLFGIIPVDDGIFFTDSDVGLLLYFTLLMTGALTIYLGGMSSGSFWAHTGATRYIIMLMCFFTLAGFSVIPPVMVTGKLSFIGAVTLQEGGIANWILFRCFPFNIISCIVFITVSMIPLYFNPFSNAFNRFEVSGGAFTEYSGVLLFFFLISRYALIFISASVAVILFFGGWQPPFIESYLPGIVWFLLKDAVLLIVLFLGQNIMPSLRLDQVLNVNWKILFIAALIAVTGTGTYCVFN